MAFGEIQLGEIVVVGLDVRAFGDGKAHVGEDRGEFVDHLADRMNAARFGRRLAHRQRDVDGLAGEPRVERGVAQRGLARGDRARRRDPSGVDQRPCALRSSGVIVPSVVEQRRDRALLAERGDAHGFERGFVGAAAMAARIRCSSC